MCVFSPLQTSAIEQSSTQKIAESADKIAIGFSNGVLILYDTLKNDVVYKNLSFVKGKKSIDCLKTCTFQVRVGDVGAGTNQSFYANTQPINRESSSLHRRMQQQSISKIVVIFCLAEGQLSDYEVFPNICEIETSIHD